MNEKVVVHVRMRPLSDDENKRELICSPMSSNSLNANNGIDVFDPQKKLIHLKKGTEEKSLYFDSLLVKKSHQNEVFDKTSKAVVDVIIYFLINFIKIGSPKRL